MALLDQSSTDVRLQLNKANFLGRDGFSWWIGQVADLKSSTAEELQLQANVSGGPLYYDRVKVRIMGNHTGEGNELEDKNLPWAHIMIPAGEPNGTLGSGKSHQYKGGETVIGFYLDDDSGQQPVIIGSFYKHSGVASKTSPSAIAGSKSSGYKPFEPTRIENPQQQNTKTPSGAAGGTNVSTKVSTSAGPPAAQKPGLETTVVGSATGDAMDLSRAADVFSQKSNDTTQPVAKCEQDEISRITKEISELQKSLSKVQEYEGKFVNYVSGKIIDLDNKIDNVVTKITETVSGQIKFAEKELFKEISLLINDQIDLLFTKSKQAQAGNEIRNLNSELYCLFKNIAKSLFGLVSGIFKALLDQLFGNLLCNINKLISTIFNTVSGVISNLISPIIAAINEFLGATIPPVTGIIKNALGIGDVIKSLLNCQSSPCAENNEQFSMSNGPIISSIPSFSSVFADSPECPNSFESGPPLVQIIGPVGVGTTAVGVGSTAVVKAIINDLGQILGFDIISGGFGYTKPPIVSLNNVPNNGFNNGSGSVLGPAIINNNGTVVAIPIINHGSGYLNTIVTVVPGELPILQPNLIIENLVPEIDIIYIDNGGIGYSSNDTVESGGGQWQVVPGPNGIIIGLNPIKLPNPTGTRVPDLIINTSTGVGAILVPIIKFSRPVGIGIGIGSGSIRVNPTKFIQIIDCVQR
jgi:hypothetical protein